MLAEEAVRARLDGDGDGHERRRDVEITHHIACSR